MRQKDCFQDNQSTNTKTKMDKQSFITSLKEKAGVDNISERSYEEVANLFASQFADDSKVTEESWGFPVQMVKTMSGQLRHDTSAGINDFKSKFETEQKNALEKSKEDAIAAFKAEWEKTHQNEPPKQEPAPNTPDISALVAAQVEEKMKGLTGDDSEFGKLNKQLRDYLKLQAEKDKAATEASIREQVRDHLIGLGVDEKDFALRYTLEHLDIGDKPDISALKTKAEKDYESTYKEIHYADGAKPFAGGGGEGGNGASGAEAWLKGRDQQTKAESEAAEARRKLLR